jgi:CheY-like chemotaxis protein
VKDAGSISGHRILIIEDEALVAMVFVDMLEEIGCEIVAVASTLDEGLARAREARFDLAVLDFNLGGVTSLPIADMLLEDGRPFLIVTGYGPAGLPPHLHGTPILTKPISVAEFEKAIGDLLGVR